MQHANQTGKFWSRLTRTTRWMLGWLMLAGWLAAMPVRADGPDDDYLAISSMIDDGDALNAGGKLAEAHAKYLQAREALEAFHRDNPDWNPLTVNLRLRQLAEKADGTVATTTVDSGPPAASPSVATPKPAAGPAIRLLSNGDEPRQLLRLHPQAGDQQDLVMTMQIGMTMSMGGNTLPATSLPAMVFATGMKVTDVSPAGIITYEMTIKDVNLKSEGNLPAAATVPLKALFAKLVGLRGVGRVSEAGVVEKFEFKLPPGTDPTLAQTMGQMKDSFQNSFQTLPTEPVGPGARWEVKNRVISQGMALNQTTTTELVAADGDHLSVKVSLQQDAANQQIRNPALPAVSVHLVKLTGTGTGQNEIDLARLAPVSGTMTERVETQMSMNMGQKPTDMDMKMTMSMNLTSK